jgi:hypothetical protein
MVHVHNSFDQKISFFLLFSSISKILYLKADVKP